MSSVTPDPWRRVVEAVLDVAAGLDLEILLSRVVRTAMTLLDAEYGALGVLDPQGHLERFVHEGIPEAHLTDMHGLPEGAGVLGSLVTDPRPLRLAAVTDHPDSVGFPFWHPRMTTFIGVPVRARGTVFGNLFLTNKRGGQFTELDQQMLEALAAAAGLAVDNARLHASARDVALLRERERIATDLHDSVVQELFAVGLGMQSALPLVDDESLRERLASYVTHLDAAISDLRATILGLENHHVGRSGLRGRIAEVVTAETECVENVRIRVSVTGPVDATVDTARAENLIHALREALSNAVRHADATEVSVSVAATVDRLALVITDNGSGMPPVPRAGHGLRNITRRSSVLGGTCRVADAPGGGTEVTWEVPLAR